MPLVKKKFPPFYVGTVGYEKHLKKYMYRRNDHEVSLVNDASMERSSRVLYHEKPKI